MSDMCIPLMFLKLKNYDNDEALMILYELMKICEYVVKDDQ